MKSARLCVLIVALFICFTGLGQSGDFQIDKNELGITTFRLQTNFETINNPVVPKIILGAYYIRNLGSGWGWVSAIDGGNNFIDDDCPGCADHIEGEGRLKEFNLASGIRKTFFKSVVRPYVLLGLQYSWSKYTGNFGGGLTGTSHFNANYITQFAGIRSRFGAIVYPHPRVTVTLSSGAQFGRWLTTSKYGWPPLFQSVSLIELRFGYRF